MLKGFIILLFIVGIIFIISYYIIISKKNNCDQKIIFKYIPRTLEEEETDPIYVSEILAPMFSQPSVWIDSIFEDNKRKTENLNKYFITQF